MAKCNCSGQTCGCRLIAGAGVTVEGSGTARDPWVVSAGAGEGGGGGFTSGDVKETVKTDTEPGWLECNGQTVSRTGYPSLFAAIGTRWGAGDGFSTFNVPNFGGRFRVGAGPGYPLAASGGNATTTLTVGNLPAHTHTINHVHFMDHRHGLANHTHSDAHDHGTGVTSADGNHDHDVRRVDTTTVSQGTGANKTVAVAALASDTYKTSRDGSHSHNASIPSWTGRTDGPSPNGTDPSDRPNTDGPNNPNSGSTGSGQEFSNLPPYRAVRVLIKV